MPYFISADKAILTDKDKTFQVITGVACGVIVLVAIIVIGVVVYWKRKG